MKNQFYSCLRCLVCVIALLLFSRAKGQVEAQITYRNSEQISDGGRRILEKQLESLMSGNDKVLSSYAGKRFRVNYEVSTLNKEITNTAPPLIVCNFSVDLTFESVGYTEVIAFQSFLLKGVGKTDRSAEINAFKKLSSRQEQLDQFIAQSSRKVDELYEGNCERIMAEIDALKALRDYDGAIYKLRTIPSSAKSCFDQATRQMKNLYVQSMNENCKVLINIAESALALRRFQAVAYALIQIHPEADCYEKAAEIKRELTKLTGERYERIWAYENKSLELAGNAIDSKYKAVAEVYKASNSGSSYAIRSGQNSSGGISINNVAINGQKEAASLTPPLGEERKSVQFKIVSPLAQANREVVVEDEMITLYGIIEEPEVTQSLLIDGLETSWDNEGIFTRTISVPEEGKEIKVQLFDKSGGYSIQSFRLVRLEKPVSTTIPQYVSIKDLTKHALVIGVGDYSNPKVRKLKNPKNDAEDMTLVLNSLGFEVNTLYDSDKASTKKQIDKFVKQMGDYDVSLFFFAGHGMEIDQENYLMPIDASNETEEKVVDTSINISDVIKNLNHVNDDKLVIMILDACRSHYISSRGGEGEEEKGGLTRMMPPTGMVVAYATSPGSTASDGLGDNGLYTGELIKQMKIPQRIEDVFMNTRNAVEIKSDGDQRPWEEARLRGVFYLKTE